MLSATPFHNNVKELNQLISLLSFDSNDGIISIITEGLERFNSRFADLKNKLSIGSGIHNEGIENFYDEIEKIYEGTNNNLSTMFEDYEPLPERPKELQNSGQKNRA